MKTIFEIPPKKKDFDVSSLDDAYIILSKALDEYANLHNMSESVLQSVTEVLEKAYLEKKAEYYLGNKMCIHVDYMNTYVNFMSNKILGHDKKFSKDCYNAIYVKHLKELVNE